MPQKFLSNRKSVPLTRKCAVVSPVLSSITGFKKTGIALENWITATWLFRLGSGAGRSVPVMIDTEASASWWDSAIASASSSHEHSGGMSCTLNAIIFEADIKAGTASNILGRSRAAIGPWLRHKLCGHLPSTWPDSWLEVY